MCSAINLGSDYSPSLSLHSTLKLSPRKTAGRVPSLPSLATLPGPQWSRAACYKGRLVQKTCASTLWSQMSSSSFPTKNYSEISKCLGFLLIVWKNSFLYISAMWHSPPPGEGGVTCESHISDDLITYCPNISRGPILHIFPLAYFSITDFPTCF